MPDFDQVLAEVEDRKGRLAERRVEAVGLVEVPFDIFGLAFQIGGLGCERGLVDGPAEVAVEQAVLHGRQLGPPLGQRLLTLGLNHVHLVERRRQRLAEPLGDLRRGQAEGLQFGQDCGLHVGLLPPYLRMPSVGMVVGAAVVDVGVAVAITKFPVDSLPSHGEPAVAASQNAAGEHDIGVASAAVATVENVLARLEGPRVDQQTVLALEHLAVPRQFAKVEAVTQDVG